MPLIIYDFVEDKMALFSLGNPIFFYWHIKINLAVFFSVSDSIRSVRPIWCFVGLNNGNRKERWEPRTFCWLTRTPDPWRRKTYMPPSWNCLDAVGTLWNWFCMCWVLDLADGSLLGDIERCCWLQSEIPAMPCLVMTSGYYFKMKLTVGKAASPNFL